MIGLTGVITDGGGGKRSIARTADEGLPGSVDTPTVCMVTRSAAGRSMASGRSRLACGLTKTAAPFADHRRPLPAIRRPPYDIQPEQVARDLQTSLTHGLSEPAVQARVATYGKNAIYQKRQLHVRLILWRQIANAITFVLLIALVISFAARDYPEGGVIAGTRMCSLTSYFSIYRRKSRRRIFS